MSNSRQHYDFVYFALPIIVFGSKENFYRQINDANADQYLKKLWNGFREKVNGTIFDKGIGCEKKVLAKGKEIFTISLPAPSTSPEAAFISIVYTIDQGFFRKKIKDVRYFTLELGFDYERNEKAYFIGETIYRGAAKFDHKSLGVSGLNDPLALHTGILMFSDAFK